MGDHDRVRTDTERAVQARLEAFIDHLPEVSTAVDGFGHYTFKVKGQTFIFLSGREDGTVNVCVKADKAQQQAIIDTSKWTRAAYIGQHGWIHLVVDGDTDWDDLADRVEDSFWRQAPKSLVRRMGR